MRFLCRGGGCMTGIQAHSIFCGNSTHQEEKGLVFSVVYYLHETFGHDTLPDSSHLSLATSFTKGLRLGENGCGVLWRVLVCAEQSRLLWAVPLILSGWGHHLAAHTLCGSLRPQILLSW